MEGSFRICTDLDVSAFREASERSRLQRIGANKRAIGTMQHKVAVRFPFATIEHIAIRMISQPFKVLGIPAVFLSKTVVFIVLVGRLAVKKTIAGSVAQRLLEQVAGFPSGLKPCGDP